MADRVDDSVRDRALLAPAGGATVVEVACPDDAFLLRLVSGDLAAAALTEADAHLDGCEACREAVIELARDAGAATLRRGATVGRYVVLGIAGRGGMGVVHVAYDTELERKVALKLLGDSPERLVREAQAMARLSHPNVVGVYEVGALGDELYLAMEYVDGLSLRDWLLAARRGWRTIRDLFVQAGRGLAAAHAVGLVHRDVKPDNVVIGADGRARVTDFGLARAQAGDAAPAPSGDLLVTRTGAVVGTPAYMAPEQLDGQPADARADQFGLCVALYEALVGRRPFTGDSIAALRAAIERGPEAPGAGAEGPAWLHRVVLRGLAADPDARWPSMEALLDALERDRGARARPVLALAGVAAVAATLAVAWTVGRDDDAAVCTGGPARAAEVWNGDRAAALATAFTGDRTREGRTVAAAIDRWRDDWVAMYGGRCRATRAGEQSEALLDAQMHCLDRRLREVGALVAALDDDGAVAGADAIVAALPALEVCADAAALTGVEPPPADRADDLAALEARIDRGRARVITGRYDDALAEARAVVDAAVEVGYRPALAEAQLLLAEAARGAGRAEVADEAAREALLAAEAGRADALVARAWIARVGIAGERGRYQEAARLGRHAVVWVERTGAPVALEARLRNTLGLIHYNRGALDDAGRELDRALSLRVGALGAEHPEVARTLTALGNLARARGDYPTALDYHARALAIDRAALGDAHPNVARHEHNLGGVLRLQGELAAAAEHYRRALAIEEKRLGPEHPRTALTHNSLGLVAFERGDLDGARGHFETARAVLVAAEHGEAAVALHNLGRLAARAGDHATALARYREALAIYERDLGGEHERVARLWLAIGEASLGAGDRPAARAAYQRAAAIAADLEDPGTLPEDARRGLVLAAAPRQREEAPPPPAAPKRVAPPAGSTVYAPAQRWE